VTGPKLGWWWVATPVLVLGLVAFALDEVRLAGYLMAAGVGVAALVRLVLPTALSGGLAVRSKLVDVLTMTAFAVAIAVVTRLLDLRPRG
jgi:hypothetical protein